MILFQNEMFRRKLTAYKGLSSCHVSVMATEYMPVLKLLGNKTLQYPESPGLSVDDFEMEDIDIDQMNLHDEENDDDEIEDW